VIVDLDSDRRPASFGPQSVPGWELPPLPRNSTTFTGPVTHPKRPIGEYRSGVWSLPAIPPSAIKATPARRLRPASPDRPLVKWKRRGLAGTVAPQRALKSASAGGGLFLLGLWRTTGRLTALKVGLGRAPRLCICRLPRRRKRHQMNLPANQRRTPDNCTWQPITVGRPCSPQIQAGMNPAKCSTLFSRWQRNRRHRNGGRIANATG